MVKVRWSQSGGSPIMESQLLDMRRCPHCGIAAPRVTRVWSGQGPTPRTDGGALQVWGAFACASCGGVIVARAAHWGTPGSTTPVDEIFPAERTAHEDLPPVARTYLQQAYETLHAPDAATVMAASAVDAMLKEKGYATGSLYSRIDKALEDNVLTQGMATWAHAVRLDANSIRHADHERPHASIAEALQTVDFAEALGNFLYVLAAKIERGITSARNT